MAVPDPVPVIQATLSPIFLVSGASIFLNFLQTRLFRINDRLRTVGADLGTSGRREEHTARLEDTARRLVRRQRIVRNALVFGVVAVLLTMLTTILIIVPALSGVDVPGATTVGVFSLALVSFAGALVLALQDTFLSVRMAEAEVTR